MSFERVMYTAFRSDTDACVALGLLSTAACAETHVLETEDEVIDTNLPIIPIITYLANGQCRFPSKFLRTIYTDKQDPLGREIPIPGFAARLSESSRIVLAIRPHSPAHKPTSLGMKSAIQNFHRSLTGENLNPSMKTHRPRRHTRRSVYESGGLFGAYDY